MQPRGLLPGLQVAYMERDETSPHPQTLFLLDYIFNIILPLRHGLPSALFPSDISTKLLYTFLHVRYMPFLFRSIWPF
jgi:hypothetical protein